MASKGCLVLDTFHVIEHDPMCLEVATRLHLFQQVTSITISVHWHFEHGQHEHLVVKGNCREVVEQVKALIQEEVFCTLSTIVLVASKSFLSHHLLNEDGEGLVETLKRKKLCPVMENFTTLYSPNVRNLVSSFKHILGNRGYTSSIMALKANIGYNYIRIVVF